MKHSVQCVFLLAVTQESWWRLCRSNYDIGSARHTVRFHRVRFQMGWQVFVFFTNLFFVLVRSSYRPPEISYTQTFDYRSRKTSISAYSEYHRFQASWIHSARNIVCVCFVLIFKTVVLYEAHIDTYDAFARLHVNLPHRISVEFGRQTFFSALNTIALQNVLYVYESIQMMLINDHHAVIIEDQWPLRQMPKRSFIINFDVDTQREPELTVQKSCHSRTAYYYSGQVELIICNH